MSLWYCDNCNTITGNIGKPTGICSKCGEELHRVELGGYMEVDMDTLLSGSLESDTVFLDNEDYLDEYKYMVVLCTYDKRKGSHFFQNKLVTLDHEFYEQDYREIERRYTNEEYGATIVNVIKEPLV